MECKKKILVIGGGIFGCNIAYFLSKIEHVKVELIEMENSLLSKASKHNHNRIHMGYHYLRSIKTAKQSIEGLNSLMQYYGESIIYQFPNYYAIAKDNSKTSTDTFEKYCKTVGIEYEQEYPSKKYLNSELIAGCYRVPEPVFDYHIIHNIITQNLKNSQVKIRLQTTCQKIEKINESYHVNIENKVEQYDIVINCAYAQLNNIHDNLINIESQIEYIYEDVILPIFKYPSSMIGLTVMDGDFCSIMPKGKNNNMFLLYHVQHSIIQRKKSKLNPFDLKNINTKSIIDKIKTESKEYYPFLQKATITDYWRELRVVTGSVDDERLTEINVYPNLPGYYSVFSGKITTCVKTALNLKSHIEQKFNL